MVRARREAHSLVFLRALRPVLAVAVLLIASGIILCFKGALKAAEGGPTLTNETGIGRAELSADERARAPRAAS